ncbi:MAG: hypothetical protein AAF403_07880, partial [Pseudomonadota bacterium]
VLNFGLGDVAFLVDLLIEHGRLGVDLGSSSLLSQYHKKRLPDNLLLITATSFLNQLFSNNIETIKYLRRFGLAGVGSSKILKRLFTRYAMGMHVHHTHFKTSSLY